MQKITRSKFLTTIDKNGDETKIKTKVFDEITGIDNAERIEELSGLPGEPIEIPEVKEETLGDRYRGFLGGYDPYRDRRYSKAKLSNFFDETIMFNGKEISFDRFLEACDLSPTLFHSAIKNASFTDFQHQLRYDIQDYITMMYSLLKYAVRPDKVISIGTLDNLFEVAYAKCVIPRNSGGKFYIDEVNGRKLYCKYDFPHSGSKLNILHADVNVLHNITNQMNFIFRQLSFYYKDEEMFITPITIGELSDILIKCENHISRSQLPNTRMILIGTLIPQLMKPRTNGIGQGLLNLANIDGKETMLRTSNLIPKPLKLAIEQTGKYGSAKTLSWKIERNLIKLLKF